MLQEFRSVVENAAQLAFIDDLLCERNRGRPAIVVPDHIGDTCALYSLYDVLRFVNRSSQWFFAEHDFARLGSRNRNTVVRVVWTCDVDNVDTFAVNQRPPVSFKRVMPH